MDNKHNSFVYIINAICVVLFVLGFVAISKYNSIDMQPGYVYISSTLPTKTYAVVTCDNEIFKTTDAQAADYVSLLVKLKCIDKSKYTDNEWKSLSDYYLTELSTFNKKLNEHQIQEVERYLHECVRRLN